MTRVVPEVDERSAPFWEAAAAHRLVLTRCDRCNRICHPPDVVCGRCHDPKGVFRHEPVEGGATIRSWITMRQSFLPGFDDLVPFVLVDASLDVDDDVRLIGRLLDGPDAVFAIGHRVSIEFEDIAPGVALPAFALEPRA